MSPHYIERDCFVWGHSWLSVSFVSFSDTPPTHSLTNAAHAGSFSVTQITGPSGVQHVYHGPNTVCLCVCARASLSPSFKLKCHWILFIIKYESKCPFFSRFCTSGGGNTLYSDAHFIASFTHHHLHKQLSHTHTHTKDLLSDLSLYFDSPRTPCPYLLLP